MAITIKETFEVDAPIDVVWRFVMDPAQVASCMPGAKLEEVINETTFDGSIKVKVGAIMAAYKGRAEMVKIDEANYCVELVAEGKETSGGTAKATMVSTLRTLDSGATEVVADAEVDLTGRIMQVSRGMIQGVSHQLFLQFVAKATKLMNAQAEAEAAAAGEVTSKGGDETAVAEAQAKARAEVQATVGSQVAAEGEALAVLPLLLKTIWAAIVGFFRRLFGKS